MKMNTVSRTNFIVVMTSGAFMFMVLTALYHSLGRQESVHFYWEPEPKEVSSETNTTLLKSSGSKDQQGSAISFARRFASERINNAIKLKNRPARIPTVARCGEVSSIPTLGDPNRNITLLYYSGFFGKVSKPPYAITNAKCTYNCFVTTDHTYAEQADAFIVHARDYISPPQQYEDKPWILHCQENPAYSPKMRDSKEMAKFSYETTARLDSDFPFPSWNNGIESFNAGTNGGGPSTRVLIPFSEKRKVPIYAVNSNCEPVRTSYQKELMKYVDVDSYGSCLHNKNGLTGIYTKNFHIDAAKLQTSYKFTLVFMNADCDLWVDTRLLYALDAGSVPIFMGTWDVERFLPGMEDSIIKVSDFPSPKDLAEYIQIVAANSTLYNSYVAWKHRGPVNYTGTEMEPVTSNMQHWYCNICDRVRKDPRPHQGRIKADKCTMRRKYDWLPTPKRPTTTGRKN